MSKPGDLVEAFGDFMRVGIADVGDTYQRMLFGTSTLSPPGLMLTTHDPEPERPMNNRQLQLLIDQQPGYPDTRPKVGLSPDEDEAPMGLTGQLLSPERGASPQPSNDDRVDDGYIEGNYEEIGPSPALPPPDHGPNIDY